MRERIQVAVSDIRNQFLYDPETGIITRRSRPDAKCGGKTPTGYLTIRVGGGLKIMAHRIAWAHYYGEWPPELIDHKDRNGLNNKISNLRLCNYSQNQWNRTVAAHSLTGVKGVTFDRTRNRWMARLMCQGKFKNLGRFMTKEAAHAAYSTAVQCLHGEFARVA